jgi:autotransporter-associated beta strand protein
MRAHLLATTAAVALLATTSAHAQDATWSTAPGSSDFNTAANWTPATVPTGTAFFGASTITGLTFNTGAVNSLGGFTFNAGAPAYSFSLALASSLTFTGAGIVNNSSNAPSFFVPISSLLAFTNSSTAGNAIITNSGTSAVTQFSGSSTAANATITNTNNGFTSFNDTSTAGNANITSSGGGFASFLGSSTAGNAILAANFRGFTTFSNSSTAGNATIITNVGGSTSFANSSSAGNATVITNPGGTTSFSQFSTGGNAAFTTLAGGVFDMSGVFFGMTAGSIAGGGAYFLGSNALVVGGNNLSTTVGGTISDGGASGGTGGSLVKVGTGTLTLAGTSSYTGATVVTGGTLSVTGDISSSSGVTVTPGATLAGTGTVPGVTINGGILMPGQSVGTLNVKGSLAFTSAATYLLNINAFTASLTNVTGTAALGGATVQVVDDKDITKRKVYTLLTASGGIVGTFNPDIVGVKNKVELFYDANHVYLCDHCKFSDLLIQQLPFFSASLPAEVGQIAGAIDAAIDANITLPTRFANLLALALQPQLRPQLVNALTQLTGEVHTGAEQAGFQVMDKFLRLMLDPFAETRVAGGAGSAIGFAPERSATFPPDVALAYASVLKEPAASGQPALASRPWNVWASGYGGRANISGEPASVGSHDNSVRDYGYAAGLDYRVAPDATLGFALAGAGTDWSIGNALGTGRSDVFQAGLYGSKRWGAAYVSAALAYATYWMSTDRFVNIFGTDHLTSNFTAHNFAGRIEGGYRFATPVVAVTPYGAFQAQRFYLPGYSEIAPSGSSIFALTYNSQHVSTTRSELGAWFDKTVLVADTHVATLFARAAWAHDWGNDRALSTNFLTLPTPAFIINGAAPPPDKALVSGGSELRLRNGWSVTGKFDGEFASRLQTYAGTGTLRYTW